MNLLLVNDEELLTETLKDNISWEQYGISHVFTAYSTEGGRDYIDREQIDILLLDIEMPEEDGLSLLRWARENEKELECIFLTCHASFDYAKEAIELDCQDYVLLPAKYEKIGNAVLKVVKRIKKQREERRFSEYGKTVLQERIDESLDSCHSEKKTEVLVRDVKKYIIENMKREELTVKEIAEHFFLHHVYLNRIFKKETGKSISQWLLDERMHMAAELLKTGKMNANSVAEQVGYYNYSNFYSIFKKCYGISPRQYQKELS